MMTKTETTNRKPTVRPAEIVREHGPFAGADRIHGVTYDGRQVWVATQVWRGPTEASGSASIATGRSIVSIPKPARCSAPSSRIVS